MTFALLVAFLFLVISAHAKTPMKVRRKDNDLRASSVASGKSNINADVSNPKNSLRVNISLNDSVVIKPIAKSKTVSHSNTNISYSMATSSISSIDSSKRKKVLSANSTTRAVSKTKAKSNSTMSKKPLKSNSTSLRSYRASNTSKPAINHVHIFVGGTHFSGTSITERLLSSQPFSSGIRADLYDVNDTSGCHAVSPRDINRCIAPENEGGFLTKEFSTLISKTRRECIAKPFWELGRCASTFHLTEMNISQAEGGAQGVYKRLMKDWSMWWNMDRRYLVEKDIPNMFQSRFLQTVFGKDKTYFIFMLRHPLASCKYFDCNMTSLIEAWLMANDVMSSDLPYLRNFMVIHQEAYYSNASATVEGIRKFLGWPELNYIDKSHEFLNTKYRPSNQGKRMLYFHGNTVNPEDYNVTIQNNEDNILWSKVYPKLLSSYHVNLTMYEKRLNRYCYSTLKLEPICRRSVWKQTKVRTVMV